MSVTFRTRFGPGFVAEPMFQGMYFPAGEAHVKLLADKERKDVGPLTQIARINSADGNDLFELAMWADAVERRNELAILEIPYLPGARSDHTTEPVFGARVYADFINLMNLDRVICFDPHSPRMPALIQNLTVIDSTRLVRQHVVGKVDGVPQRYQGVIAPDKGAIKRATDVARACHIPVFLAEKHRNKDTGKLSDFTCEPLPDEGKFLVVDDICDGGGTFMGLAEATGLGRDRLGLYVSHGVFSGAAYRLHQYYSEIWTTDSLDTAHNIDDPWIPDEGTGKLRHFLGYKANVIPLAQTMNGYY